MVNLAFAVTQDAYEDILELSLHRAWLIWWVNLHFIVKLSLKKSSFGNTSASYCGIEVSENGYQISEKRKKILRDYPDFDVRCKKKNNDLSHLGFYNWHRRFVKDYAERDRDIRQAIRHFKDKILTAEEANSKIKTITDGMKTQILASVLITPTSDDELILQCDASGRAWGYILYCDRGVFAYGGGSFTQTQINSHNQFEKETLGMSHSLSDCYKLVSQGKHLLIKNDNLSLIKINKSNKVIVTQRMIRYLQNICVLSQLLPSKFIHLNTLENYMADVLSRLEYNSDGTIKVNAMNSFDNSELEISPSVFYFYENDEKLLLDSDIDEQEASQVLSLFKKPEIKTGDDKFLLDYYRNLHSNFHWSQEKTSKILRTYGLPVNEELITEAWLECPFCNKYKKVAPLTKLKFREAPELPFDEVHIDHIIKNNDKQSSFGHKAALTVKCSLTRYFFIFPVKDVKIRTVVDQLQLCFMSVARIPKKIYADNAFDSTTMHDFCKRNNIAIAFRASNLSRSVSVESTHRRYHEKEASMLGNKSRSRWHEVAWKAAMALNIQPNKSVGFTPHYLFFGKHPEKLGDNQLVANVNIDKQWLSDLKLAKFFADSQRKATSSNYKYEIFKPGDEFEIRSDNSKNAIGLKGIVVEDSGGATALVKLENRPNPISIHKGMLFAKKYSDAWKQLHGTNRDFSEFKNKTSESEPENVEPVACRLRSKTNKNSLSACEFFYNIRKMKKRK